MLEALLIVATLLGGGAALIYFWEKFRPGRLSRIKFVRRPPAVPIDAASLSAYAYSHPRPLGLAREIARRRRFKWKETSTGSAWLVEQVQALGIRTVRELDSLVKKHASTASRLSDYLTPQQPIDSCFVLGRVIEVVALERGGEDELRRLLGSLKYSSVDSGYVKEIVAAYQQIKRYK
jgi:hypothetical protein